MKIACTHKHTDTNIYTNKLAFIIHTHIHTHTHTHTHTHIHTHTHTHTHTNILPPLTGNIQNAANSL